MLASGGCPNVPFRTGWNLARCLSSQVPPACPLLLLSRTPGAPERGYHHLPLGNSRQSHLPLDLDLMDKGKDSNDRAGTSRAAILPRPLQEVEPPEEEPGQRPPKLVTALTTS